MPIFRGDGGSGDSNTDATITVVTQQAIIATDKASEAAASASSASSSATAAGNSATAAAASATGVQAYATAAANSATAAASSATGAATSATNASTAQTNAETAETNAETAETNAETAETNAVAQVSLAAAQVTLAAGQVSLATTQASSASTSATSASNSASTASGYVTDAAAEVVLAAAQVTLATTQATNAATSATNAASSESAVATSATNAANSATAAASSASGASTSATNANNSAIAAAASAASIGTDPSFNSVTVTGTTAVKMSAGTTAQRPTGVAGHFRYNTTEGKFEGYSTEWGEIGGGAADLKLNSFTGNGSTTAYTLSSSPVEDNTLVYIDGVYQNKTGYAIVDNVLTFSAAPPNTSAIEITAATIAPVAASTEFKLSQFTGNGSTVAFTLSAQSPENNTNVYIDGVYQSKSNYSVSGTTLTFSTAPPNGSAVEVMAAHAVVVSVSTPDDGTVTTAKIVDANVTTAKIADANVTTAKIADGSITSAKLGAGVGGAFNDFAIKTTAYTAATRDQLIVNSSSAVTITLPASPSAGNVVFIKNAGTGVVTVGRNGSKINSTTDDGSLAADAGATLVYVDATIGWKEL